MSDYDGRYSAECELVCQEGECGAPRSTAGCGSCCGCMGGCFRGYEEQLAEEQAADGGDA